jgi:hypothetical protein
MARKSKIPRLTFSYTLSICGTLQHNYYSNFSLQSVKGSSSQMNHENCLKVRSYFLLFSMVSRSHAGDEHLWPSVAISVQVWGMNLSIPLSYPPLFPSPPLGVISGYQRGPLARYWRGCIPCITRDRRP